MTIKTFFTILAVLAIIHGIGFVLAPDQLATVYGLEHSLAMALLSRLFGSALLAWGGIVWYARDFRDEGAVRAVLISTGIADVISVVVTVMGTLAGTMNEMGWVAVLIYLFSALGCGYFLMGRSRL
jgi:hypothetical protein